MQIGNLNTSQNAEPPQHSGLEIPQAAQQARVRTGKFMIAGALSVVVVVGAISAIISNARKAKLQTAPESTFVRSKLESPPVIPAAHAQAAVLTTQQAAVTENNTPRVATATQNNSDDPAPLVAPPTTAERVNTPPQPRRDRAPTQNTAPRNDDPNSKYARTHKRSDLGTTNSGEAPVTSGNASSGDPALDSIDAQLAALKRQEQQLASGGGGGAMGMTGDTRDPNIGYSESVYAKDTAVAQARPAPDLTYRIIEGKIISAKLESALNSQLPGKIRAMVDQDIFSENGKTILIPRGSRLIGEYNTDVKNGQSRVFVAWPRLIRPDGIDIRLDSSSSDNLGRAGVAGAVETHFWRRFGTSALLSLIGIGASSGGDQATNPAFANADLVRMGVLQSFGNTSAQILQQSINVKDTIMIDQGEPIKVFVAKDLDFADALKRPRRKVY